MSRNPAPVALLTIAVLAGVVRNSAAQPIDDALRRFDAAVQEDSRQLYGGRGDPGTVRSMLRQAQGEIGGRRWSHAIEWIQQLKYSVGTARVAAAAAPVVTQLRILEQEVEQEYLRQIDAGVEKAANACRNAQTASELDSVIAELTPLVQRWPNEGREESLSVAQAREKMRSALRYLQYWQDYLSLRAGGKDVEAAQKMAELARQYEWYPVVPRSEVLARSVPPPPRERPPVDPQEKIREAFASVRAITDLDAVHEELKGWAKQWPEYRDFAAAAEQVGALVRARAALAAGDFGAAWQACAGPHHGGVPVELVSGWRAELLRAVLPKYLAADGGEPLHSDEEPADYLRRMAKAAAARQEWKLAFNSLEALRSLSFSGSTPRWLAREIAAVGHAVAAERAVEAKKFASAYQSYGRALATPSDLVPAKVMNARMRALRQKDPDVVKPPRRERHVDY